MKLDFSEVKENKNAAEGKQLLTIFGAKEKRSQNGTNMLVLDMKDDQEGFVRDNVCLEGAGAFRAKQLFKALEIGDLETCEKLGAFELDEEDLALCTLVDLGKNDFGQTLRALLDKAMKEEE